VDSQGDLPREYWIFSGIIGMTILAKTEYACIAVTELASHFGTGKPIRVRTIADAHGIPSRFLVQILLQLKGVGLVNSVRGAGGGYLLVTPPDEITLGQVMGLIEGRVEAVASNVASATPISTALVEAWQEVEQMRNGKLNEITFSDLLERAAGQAENMYYI